MVLKANDRRTSCLCHDEFRGPRSDYVRQRPNALKPGFQFYVICYISFSSGSNPRGSERSDRYAPPTQGTIIHNSVYGANTVTANYVQFWFRRFRSGIFDVKDAPRTGRPIVENVNKITVIEVDRHVSSRSIVQELKIEHKTVLNHLLIGFKKKLDV
ncbi:histone-lysine N-methyltransferase SETMAR [Trichonephila clavipes]|nr:histone-lysine N-methyltransferase SETMAR [Trichonephila clavipes]